MKHPVRARSRLAVAALLVVLGGTPALAGPDGWPTPRPTWSEADWSAFSENLVAGLASDNEGLKLSALQLIVEHGERLDVRAAEFDVIRLFQDHHDQRVRRLAAVACSHLKSGWAMGFLRMSEPFERDARVRATLRSIVRSQALLTKQS